MRSTKRIAAHAKLPSVGSSAIKRERQPLIKEMEQTAFSAELTRAADETDNWRNYRVYKITGVMN